MNETKKIRKLWLTIRLNEEEEKQLQKLCRKTTANSLSEYARAVLLKEPVTVLYRNKSADDFLSEVIQMTKELNAIGNNFNQAVKKLHTLDHFPEIKVWTMLNEPVKAIYLKTVADIKMKLQQIYELWLQK